MADAAARDAFLRFGNSMVDRAADHHRRCACVGQLDDRKLCDEIRQLDSEWECVRAAYDDSLHRDLYK